MTTTSLPKTQQVLAALRNDWPTAEWGHTGGGCYAIRVPLGDPSADDFAEVLVTDQEAFGGWQWETDEHLTGSWWVGGYHGSGDPIAPIQVIREEMTEGWADTLTMIRCAVEDQANAVVSGHGFQHPDQDTPEMCVCGAAFTQGFHLGAMKRAHLDATSPSQP